MNEAYLLLGGNIGDSKTIINNSIELIELLCGNVVKKSSIYQSEAWGFTSEQAFLNQVVLIETKFSPEVLLESLLSIEQKLGRERKLEVGYSSRKIDIDILFYNELIIDGSKLTIPHPLLHKRRFTLMPLNEIATNYIHPILLKNIYELLDECSDYSIVKLDECCSNFNSK